MRDRSRSKIRPLDEGDYPSMLSVLNAMWPQFTFQPIDLIQKEQSYGAQLTRWGFWHENRLLAFCNLYESNSSLSASWFYQQSKEGNLAVIELIGHTIDRARSHRKVLYSRVLDSHPLWEILRSRGFVCRSRTTDWVLRPPVLASKTDLFAQTDEVFWPLEHFKGNSEAIRQLFDIEATQLNPTPPWFTQEVFARVLLSTPSVSPHATTALVSNGEIQGYALVLLDESKEYKVRKILSFSKNPDVVEKLLKHVIELSETAGHSAVWVSAQEHEALGQCARRLGFIPLYCWLGVFRTTHASS